MAYKHVLLGDYFKFEKGLGYKGEFLVDDSEVGLVGIDSQVPGGGYKENSEKPYSGPYKPEHVVQSGDVIVTSTDITQDGSVLGSTFMIPESTKYETLIYSGDVLKVIPTKPEEFSPEYLYNLYRVEKYRRKLAYGDTGTTVRRISDANLNEQLVPLPDVKTQESINEVISLIDQKIENNKSLAKNLEALSQVIFKSWFVDFEPVHAKSRGEKPFGMDDETAKLFPDSFDKSEAGIRPTGWKLAPVKEIFTYCGGGTPSTKNNEFWNGHHLWTTPRDLSRQKGIVTVSTERKLTDKGVQKISSKLLPIDSVLLSSRAPIGYVSIAGLPTAINQGFIAFPKQDKWPTLYLFNWLHQNMHEIIAHSGGGTFSEISKNAFGNIDSLIPEPKIVQIYGELTAPLLDLLKTLSKENIQLENFRTYLLADLIDGNLPQKMIEV